MDVEHDHMDVDDELTLQGKMLQLFALTRSARMRGRNGRRSRGVFHGQGRVLHLLSLQSSITQRELAYLLGIRPQSLGELLSKLEAAELVKREPNPDDRRTSIVELTEKGQQLAEERKEFIGTDPFEVLSDEEKETLSGLLDKVINSLEEKFPETAQTRMQFIRDRRHGRRHHGHTCGCK